MTRNGCYIAVDLGTTNTRVWLIEQTHIRKMVTASVGARDTAREGNNQLLRATLRDLVAAVTENAELEPQLILGAGMLTSALGLKEVPHTSAPAGADELIRAIKPEVFEDISALPFFLVPGVRVGAVSRDDWNVDDTDVIRGEETLCVGLVAMGALSTGAMVLNLGSHWKAIAIDAEGRIHHSVTDLAGEMMFAVQDRSILANSLPTGRLEEPDETWLMRGIEQEERSGLARALFCVRLLDLNGKANSQQRMSFFAGAFISHTMTALRRRSMLSERVVICGSAGIARAWQIALERAGIAVENLSTVTEDVFLRGIAELAGRL